MSESVRVVVKCRPMNQREKDLRCQSILDIDSKTGLCSIRNPSDKTAPAKAFTFDGAYDEEATNEQVYSDIAFSLVEAVTEGYNGTVFAYGQTGCGKTFSMQGIVDPPSERGLIPRAFEQIFDTIAIADTTRYLIHASYLEIYNEDIRDLLGKDMKARLELKEKPDASVFVKDLSMHPCATVRDCEQVMTIGWSRRAVGATLMNASSSRSHSIFTIHLERCDVSEDGDSGRIRVSKLNLVDLAGSERQSKTGATGNRLKEATKINLSLSALGNVISALVDGRSQHIPYRDSKLTRLLQDSLGGNTKTLMVTCLSPADNNYEETLSSLSMAENDLDYVKVSTEGIKMILNNDWQKAEALFSAHKDASVQMSAGNSFVCFLQALMTFEEDKLELANAALAETIDHCKSNRSNSKLRKTSGKENVSAEERLLREVIATDCLLYQAGLVVIHQDITSYIKGGWYLRQAWRSYKRLYHEILALRDDDDPFIMGRESSTDPVESPSLAESVVSTPEDCRDMHLEFGWHGSLSNLSNLSRSSKDRLLAAVCFGYGSFQLFISLCPPKVLRLIHFLGFEGDKDLGLKCLDFTSQTDGMMAPLATLVLVYYHSVVRPFFALDGPNLCAGIFEANRILERASVEYPESALFLYFRSRVQILEGKPDEALETCRRALAMSTHQRETQHVCLYEIGRLSMMKLQWQEAADSFHRLRKESRWARSYYAYIAALCYGCLGDTEKTLQLLVDVPKLVKLKNNQLEMFVNKRASHFLVNVPTPNQMLILSLEMLYIWTLVPNCSKADLQTMLKGCREESAAEFRPLCCLIEGVIYKELNDFHSAEKSLKKAMELYDYDRSVDTHIAAFACFELAMLKGQMGSFHESRRYFMHIKDHYKNYNFEPRLSVKVSAALKRLTEEEAEQSGGNSACTIQ